MRNLILSFVFLVICVFTGTHVFDNFINEGKVKEAKAASLAYPDELIITNHQGDAIEITLLGRSESHIQFARNPDRQVFVYALSELSSPSRQEVLKYPAWGLEETSQQVTGNSLAQMHVQNLQKEIARIDAKCERLRADYKRSNSTTERRTIMREFEALQRERGTYENRIADSQ